MRNPFQTLFFSLTSKLTTYFPRAGARILDVPIRMIIGSRLVSAILGNLNRIKLKKVRSYRRFLVHPDIHIGDAIMAQSAVTALRDFFPDAEVDFVANKSVMTLIEGNPEVTRFLPIYSGGVFPPDSELETVVQLMKQGKYDLCININPFLTAAKLGNKTQPVFDFTTHAPTLIRNENTTSEVNHLTSQYHRFVHDLLSRSVKPKREVPFTGVAVRLSDSAIEEASRFMEGFRSDRALVLMNSDTASPYTRIPFQDQSDLMNRLLPKDVSILVGAGHTEAGIGQRLLETIPTDLRSRVRLIPAEMSLPAYSALTDQCDLFISGDTGPLHIAAARKHSRSGKYTLRNRTAVLCIFGATTSRMSGYASLQPGYLAANQEAPSWTVVGESPCRNITCLNKLFKTCETVRCFEKLDTDKIVELVLGHLKQNCDSSRLFSDNSSESPRLEW